MHCHLLPRIDDGARDMIDTILSLRMAEEQGVKKIIMTPHFKPNHHIKPQRVLELMDQVNDVIKRENINIEIFPGMECMYFNELPALLEAQKVLTLAGSQYRKYFLDPSIDWLKKKFQRKNFTV